MWKKCIGYMEATILKDRAFIIIRVSSVFVTVFSYPFMCCRFLQTIKYFKEKSHYLLLTNRTVWNFTLVFTWVLFIKYRKMKTFYYIVFVTVGGIILHWFFWIHQFLIKLCTFIIIVLLSKFACNWYQKINNYIKF